MKPKIFNQKKEAEQTERELAQAKIDADLGLAELCPVHKVPLNNKGKCGECGNICYSCD